MIIVTDLWLYGQVYKGMLWKSIAVHSERQFLQSVLPHLHQSSLFRIFDKLSSGEGVFEASLPR